MKLPGYYRMAICRAGACMAVVLLVAARFLPQAQAQDFPPPPLTSDAENAAAAQPSFPELPPSRPCNARDPLGNWRLVHVYESPPGPETATFARDRFQYMWFGKDSVLQRYDSARNDLALEQIFQKMREQSSKVLQQFAFKSGFLYFYKQGRSTDTMACFIVANPKDSFRVGQMLLMPPREQVVAQRRLVKVYERVGHQKPPKPAASLPPAAAPVQPQPNPVAK